MVFVCVLEYICVSLLIENVSHTMNVIFISHFLSVMAFSASFSQQERSKL